MENLGTVAVVVVVLLLIVYNIRRRARMTPEQRLAEDQVRATRQIARELRRNRHF
jgi:cytochrome c-type biogenesis protein CcmH/NrfF